MAGFPLEAEAEPVLSIVGFMTTYVPGAMSPRLVWGCAVGA